jgi:SAM-dependent methyltransferase
MSSSRTNTWQNDLYLRNIQYADSKKLSARASIHTKYGRGDWFSWLASQPDWPSDGDVLEVGCGAGWFWAEAAPYLSPSLRIQLTDISSGMVKEAVIRARENGHWNQAKGCVADASHLPFSDASFDAVLASHMLYHVHDPKKALAEMARILRSNGIAVIATNGISNMRELFDLRRSVFGGEHGDQMSAAFTLENGRPMVEAVFATVELRKYPDELVCTEPRDIIDYLTSSPPGDGASESQIQALHETTAAAFEKGGGKFVVTKDVGVFMCRASAVTGGSVSEGTLAYGRGDVDHTLSNQLRHPGSETPSASGAGRVMNNSDNRGRDALSDRLVREGRPGLG